MKIKPQNHRSARLKIPEGESCVKAIVHNLSHLVELQKEIRKQAEDEDDQATADQLTSYVEEPEKTLWMYKSWLGK